MSAMTEALLTEIEALDIDIAAADSSGSDATNFIERRRELTKRLDEANEKLQKKQLLNG